MDLRYLKVGHNPVTGKDSPCRSHPAEGGILPLNSVVVDMVALGTVAVGMAPVEDTLTS